MVKFKAVAPSNIAIVKYMGKREGGGNIPENPSVSLTLNHFVSECLVTAEWVPNQVSQFSYLPLSQEIPLKLDEIERMHRHFERIAPRGLMAQWSSKNSFPKGVGIASSASAFAAATLALSAAASQNPAEFIQRFKSHTELKKIIASLSRQGSGSSCRSFFAPWVRWQEDQVFALESQLPQVHHRVLLVSSEQKRIGSSEAHRRVKTSPHWAGRVERATQRADLAAQWIARADWNSLCSMAWEEFQDMHSLFETSEESFSYRTPKTRALLEELKSWVLKGWMITMDAGPNLHLMALSPQIAAVDTWLESKLKQDSSLSVIQDRPGGRGPEVWLQ